MRSCFQNLIDFTKGSHDIPIENKTKKIKLNVFIKAAFDSLKSQKYGEQINFDQGGDEEVAPYTIICDDKKLA